MLRLYLVVNTTVKRVTIGKVSADDELKMRPNENFKKYFPEVETPEERLDTGRSSCDELRAIWLERSCGKAV